MRSFNFSYCCDVCSKFASRLHLPLRSHLLFSFSPILTHGFRRCCCDGNGNWQRKIVQSILMLAICSWRNEPLNCFVGCWCLMVHVYFSSSHQIHNYRRQKSNCRIKCRIDVSLESFTKHFVVDEERFYYIIRRLVAGIKLTHSNILEHKWVPSTE